MKFIFTIKIKQGCTEQEYIDAWKNGSAIIQKHQGARGTILYRKIDEPGMLIAIADWDSKILRDKAMRELGDTNEEMQKILNLHKAYGETEVIGNFEEIGRVNPGN